MVFAGGQGEVFGTIVGPYSIHVVDDLMCFQWSSEHVFHDDSVLELIILRADIDHNVPAREMPAAPPRRVTSAFPRGIGVLSNNDAGASQSEINGAVGDADLLGDGGNAETGSVKSNYGFGGGRCLSLPLGAPFYASGLEPGNDCRLGAAEALSDFVGTVAGAIQRDDFAGRDVVSWHDTKSITQ